MNVHICTYYYHIIILWLYYIHRKSTVVRLASQQKHDEISEIDRNLSTYLSIDLSIYNYLDGCYMVFSLYMSF